MCSYDLLISFDDLIDTFEKIRCGSYFGWVYCFALFKSNLLSLLPCINMIHYTLSIIVTYPFIIISSLNNITFTLVWREHTVMQLVETWRYKLEGHGFDSH
jgi:hypothetical protein